jgi:hypothetical protein
MSALPPEADILRGSLDVHSIKSGHCGFPSFPHSETIRLGQFNEECSPI